MLLDRILEVIRFFTKLESRAEADIGREAHAIVVEHVAAAKAGAPRDVAIEQRRRPIDVTQPK